MFQRRQLRIVDHPAVVRMHPVFDAVAVNARRGTSSRCAPVSRRWDAAGRRWPATRCGDWSAELQGPAPELLAEKTKAPSVVAGPPDPVIDPTNGGLTIHESIGHATEYDRAIGCRRPYAGTSSATPDKLGDDALRLPGDERDRRPDRRIRSGRNRFSTTEGVAAQSWDLVRDGIFVGYQLDRCSHPGLGFELVRNGCSMPIRRIDASPADGQHVVASPPQDISTADLTARVEDRFTRRRQVAVDRHAALQLQFTGSGFFRIPRRPAGTASCAMSPTRRRRPDFWN